MGRMELLIAPETVLAPLEIAELKLTKLMLADCCKAQGLVLVPLRITEVKGSPLYASCVVCKKKRASV